MQLAQTVPAARRYQSWMGISTTCRKSIRMGLLVARDSHRRSMN